MTSPTKLSEGAATFVFEAGWDVVKYDESAHYRKRLAKLDRKGCDFVTTDGDRAFLIEVKDYRHPAAGDPPDLPQVVAVKALDTLGGLASARGAGGDLAGFASKVLDCSRIHLVLSVGLPAKHKPLANPEKYLADLKQKLKSGRVLPHPVVHLLGQPGPAWTT